MGDYRRLTAWQIASELARESYRVTGGMPVSERFGLTSQIRRAAVSVVANIAEGSGRGSEREFRRFLRIARGSVQELICEIDLAIDLGFMSADHGVPLHQLANREASLLSGLLRKPFPNSADEPRESSRHARTTHDP